jgi:hypothetical protein
MSFVEVVMQTYGIQRPPKPSAEQEASRLLCDPKILCDKNEASCETLTACRQRVTAAINTNGIDRPFTSDGNVQKSVFIAEHFDILNATATDRTVSQLQAVFALIKAIPPYALVIIAITGWMLALMAFIPALVIIVQLLSNKIALAKVVTIVLFTMLVIGAYFIVPL